MRAQILINQDRLVFWSLSKESLDFEGKLAILKILNDAPDLRYSLKDRGNHYLMELKKGNHLTAPLPGMRNFYFPSGWYVFLRTSLNRDPICMDAIEFFNQCRVAGWD